MEKGKRIQRYESLKLKWRLQSSKTKLLVLTTSRQNIKSGGEPMTDMFYALCNDIPKSGKWPSQWTESVLIPIPQKKSNKKCNDYRTINLISHSSKVLLNVILNKIKPNIERVLSETQTGFRKDRSTVEQILNLRIVCKENRNQTKVYHNFMILRKPLIGISMMHYGTR